MIARRGFLAGGLAALAATARAAPPVSSASLAYRAFATPRPAGALAMTDEKGLPLRFTSLAGRLVVLNLWGPWCVPCRRELPSIARLAARLPAHQTVLPLAFDWRGAPAITAFYAELGITNLPVALGRGDNLDAVLGLSRLPTTVIVDGAGAALGAVEGEAIWDDAPTLGWLAGLTP